MDAADRVVRLSRLLGDDADRIGGIVAADIEEIPDFVRLQNLEYFLAVFQIRLVPRRAQRRGRRLADHFQVVRRLLRQIDEFLVHDPAHAVQRAIDQTDIAEFPRFQHRADERLVDDRGRTAALGHQHFSLQHGRFLRL